MKSIKQQYIDLQEGRMSQANFMRNLRMSLPQYITNVTSFNDSVRILKNKGILTENYKEQDTTEKVNELIRFYDDEGNPTYDDDGNPGTSDLEYKLKPTYKFGKETYVPTAKTKSFKTWDIERGYHDKDISSRNIGVGYVFGEYGSLGMSMTSRVDEKGMVGVYVVTKQLGEDEWDCTKLELVSQESLNEAQDNEGKWKTVNGKDLYAQFKEIDNLNGQEVLIGIDCEMEKNHELTKLEAAKIVIKNLKKIPNYYTMEYLAGKEGAEPQYLGGKSANAEARQMQPLEKNLGNIVDKKMGMQPVKDIEKVKASANKASKETIKPEKGISLMSLIAKTVRGVQKMDATGEKMKKISTK